MSQTTTEVRNLPTVVSSWVAVALLAAILVTQIIILQRMPPSPPTIPTMGAMRNAKTTDARAKLMEGIPLVRVQGGSIDADITGTVNVEVENTPLDVTISR